MKESARQQSWREALAAMGADVLVAVRLCACWRESLGAMGTMFSWLYRLVQSVQTADGFVCACFATFVPISLALLGQAKSVAHHCVP